MKQKFIHWIEINIKTKLAFVFLIIALFCTGIIFFADSLFSNFKKQQEHYHNSTQILLKTNSLVSQFYDIQEYGNMFLVHKEMFYLHIYQTQVEIFQQQLEQIVTFIHQEDANKYLVDVKLLLNEKKILLQKLQELFENRKEIDSLFQRKMNRIEQEIERELAQLETTTSASSDTVWQEQKSFGQRLREAFRSNKKRGKNIFSVNTMVVFDTVMNRSFVISIIVDSLQGINQKYQDQYATKIENIGMELYALLSTNQSITKEITDLLMLLHEEMLLNVISLGEENESKAKQALSWSIFAGTLALLLISALIFYISRNIKKIRKIHDALEIEKQKTEELMENRHQLLLAISHDIKTPLSALLGYLGMWENEALTPAQLRELSTMQYSGKYILALLNNLLEFTRLERRKSQITKENIEVVPFFMELIEMFQPLCEVKQNKLSYHINIEKNPQILVDSLKLKQIVINLISNAIKYTSMGNIEVQVDEICEINFRLKITISDTGIGIPKEKLSTLFEPFTRIEKNSSGIEGAGLGLFVVKGLIELLGGEIELLSVENQGTSVALQIPFENIIEKTDSETFHSFPQHIWVIEDDAAQLQVIISMLEKLGHTVIGSPTKIDFENQLLATGKNCNIAFTDLEMGDLNGFEVLKKIKGISNIPVVCLSGASTITSSELQQIGFDDFLEKPFSLKQLEKVLSSANKRKTNTSFKGFSLNNLYEMFGNDPATILALLNTFTASLPDDIKKMELGIENNDMFSIQQIAHKMLPFIKQISAIEVISVLERIELSKKGNRNSFSDMKADVILAVSNLKKLLAEIQNFTLISK